MPLVKIDYVVSFSSEDQENPASNLLLSDVKSKWLCCSGEPSCSVVLQLKSACKIDSITIGAYHVALIEVLVGLSEKPNDPFEVLVPSCVLLSPGASRRGDAVECVRTFGAAQFAAAAQRRWDRVRLVCSQPYNKHCKYGLAFVHINSSSAQPAPASAPVSATAPASALAPLRAVLAEADAGSSDEEFRPGELFARHQRNQSTDAQIRHATSQALKNIPDASTKLAKTPISKTNQLRNKEQTYTSEQKCNRRNENLIYTNDDSKPHAKIDRVMQAHRDNKQDKTDTHDSKTKENNDNLDKTINNDQKKQQTNKLNVSRSHNDDLNNSKIKDDGGEASKHIDKNNTPQKKDFEKNAFNNENTKQSQKKRKRSAEIHPELGPVCSNLSEVLSGVVVAMSGYVNPRRAGLRTAALEMGARYLRDWEPSCTHLICAFPNTPKLKTVRASNAPTVAVNGDWLEQCRAHRRRLPWRWFATEPRALEPIPSDFNQQPAHDDGSEGDTDDEIEKVLQQQGKKPRRNSSSDDQSSKRDQTHGSNDRNYTDSTNKTTDHFGSQDQTDSGERRSNTDRNSSHAHTNTTRHGHTDIDSHGHNDKSDEPNNRNKTDNRKSSTEPDETNNVSHESDVAFVRDERFQAQISLHSDSDATDEDERIEHPDSVEIKKELPAFWEGCTFVMSQKLQQNEAALLTRYIRAYGGLVLRECDMLEDSTVQYVVAPEGSAEGETCAGAKLVRPEWVWRQHTRKGWPAHA